MDRRVDRALRFLSTTFAKQNFRNYLAIASVTSVFGTFRTCGVVRPTSVMQAKADIKFCCVTTPRPRGVCLGATDEFFQNAKSIRKRKIIEHARDWPHWLSWPVRFCRYLGTHRK